jgi:ABC-type transporter Mla subunit MlaD
MNPIKDIALYIVAGLAALFMALAGWLYVSKAHVQTEFAQYKQQTAQGALEAEQLARKVEQGMQEQISRVIKNEQSKQKVLSDRADSLDAVNGGLRDEITRLNGRPAPTDATAAAYAGEARTARELLGTCANEYRTVAKEADQLRDQVSGLQNYVQIAKQAVQ